MEKTENYVKSNESHIEASGMTAPRAVANKAPQWNRKDA